jgi:hypothetical protein
MESIIKAVTPEVIPFSNTVVPYWSIISRTQYKDPPTSKFM